MSSVFSIFSPSSLSISETSTQSLNYSSIDTKMSKFIKLAEVNQHNSEKNGVWIVIHNEVYDVTKYLGEHPGGADALLDFAGKDGTQAFEDVGHSEDARTVMTKFRIGKIPPGETSSASPAVALNIKTCTGVPRTKSQNSMNVKTSARVKHIIVPLEERTQSDIGSRYTPKARFNPELRNNSKGVRKPDCFSVPQASIIPQYPLENEWNNRSKESDRRPSGIRFEDEVLRSWWKWAAIAAASALIVGFLVKKAKS